MSASLVGSSTTLALLFGRSSESLTHKLESGEAKPLIVSSELPLVATDIFRHPSLIPLLSQDPSLQITVGTQSITFTEMHRLMRNFEPAMSSLSRLQQGFVNLFLEHGCDQIDRGILPVENGVSQGYVLRLKSTNTPSTNDATITVSSPGLSPVTIAVNCLTTVALTSPAIVNEEGKKIALMATFAAGSVAGLLSKMNALDQNLIALRAERLKAESMGKALVITPKFERATSGADKVEHYAFVGFVATVDNKEVLNYARSK